ncbi:fimbria/pilus outer membrane usher protein [Paraburkholderia sp. BL25I1N1]|uniref:fimbria/pilus outer membrane usher protein n=1 Tax=Paraburkholderia sp. BL25I1N1 TaxID=1938804 RepID=UPI000D068941|nr:fimbria/pilus outer membrane usher protein [Paraburkholderia sp. BL25I1N1]PRY09272.1 outer membrane usher protein [Paraburkholderia sp. BL25I1N1]
MAGKTQSELARGLNRHAFRHTHALMFGALGACVSASGHAQALDGASSVFSGQRNSDGVDASAIMPDVPAPTSEPVVNPYADSPSAALGYAFNTFHTSGQGVADTQSYLGFTAGINIGNWRVREQGVLQSDTGRGTSYQNVAAYLQHDIPSLKSQIGLGDQFTDGAVFDSIGVRGVKMESIDSAASESLPGYAPVVRGVAMSNALVTVTQNGNRLYEATVAPGPFEIDDVVPTGYGGNLNVTVTEADGSRHSFTVPYASVVPLVRPASTRFSIVGGVTRDTQVRHQSALLQGAVQRGINGVITGYGGAIVADGYLSGLIGAALRTPIGALSADVSEAQADLSQARRSRGTSLRIGYSKFIEQTDTNVSVAAYGYSSGGFLTLRDAMLQRDAVQAGSGADSIGRRRNQLQITLSQRVGAGDGSLYVAGSTANYWNHSGSDTQFQIGYTGALRVVETNLNYTVSISRQRNGLAGPMSNQVFASVSLPLGKTERASSLSAGLMHDSRAGWSEQAMLAGSAGTADELRYGMYGTHSQRSTTGGGNVQYQSAYATVGASASGGSGYSQASANMRGSVFVHRGGIALGNRPEMAADIGLLKKGLNVGALDSVDPNASSPGYVPVPHLEPGGADPIDIGVHRDLVTGGTEPTSRKTASRWDAWVTRQQPAGDNVAGNVATADQTEGAERLMLFMNAVPMKVYARNSVVLWSDVERANGHH